MATRLQRRRQREKEVFSEYAARARKRYTNTLSFLEERNSGRKIKLLKGLRGAKRGLLYPRSCRIKKNDIPKIQLVIGELGLILGKIK